MNQKTPIFSAEIEETIDYVYLDLTTEQLEDLLKTPFINVNHRSYHTPRKQILEYLIGGDWGILKFKLKRIKAK